MRIVLSVLIAPLLLTSIAVAQDSLNTIPAGDPEYGKLLAETWCASCHLVSVNEQSVANADVPTFSSISKRLPDDHDRLAAFIAQPHSPMPNLNLSRQDIRDVLAYIETLE